MGRLMIWTIPRSRSTITLRLLTNTSETNVIFEHLSFAFFSKDYNNVFTYQHLAECLKKEPFTAENFVWKDVPDYVENQDFEKFISDRSVKHVLLIRNPREVCLSKVNLFGNRIYFMNVPKEAVEHPTVVQNYETMAKLLDYLKTNEFDHKVVDAERLTKEDGGQMIKDICDFAGLPFKEETMNLPKLDDFPSSWWLPNVASSKRQCYFENFEVFLGVISL